jgi:glycosyltransferase involved in cell wall biosynthesis
MKVIAVIPAHNEEEFIYQVVRQTLKYVDMVYVIDNNSTDKTSRLALSGGAIVLPELVKGAGAATSHGWRVCKGLAEVDKCDVLVTLDADGQHNPSDIPKLIEPILKNEADVVFGSRFIEQCEIPAYRRFGIQVITMCSNIYYRDEWVTDAQCGIRAFGKIAIKSMDITEKSYGLMIEQIMKARSLGLRIKEVPVDCVYRGLNKDSGMNPVKQGILTLMCILKWRIKLWV